VQDPALALVELHQVPLCPTLQPAQCGNQNYLRISIYLFLTLYQLLRPVL